MALSRQTLQERLAALRDGLASIQLDLARQDGAIQSIEWALAQLDAADQPTSVNADFPQTEAADA